VARRPILALSGATLLVGVAGAVFDFYRLATVLEGAPALAGSLATEWLVKDAALLAVAMVAALAGGLAWFVLTQWLSSVAAARRELLGLRPTRRTAYNGKTK
jgi:hypothetical protein